MADKAVNLVVGLFVAGIMIAFLLPVGIGAMTDAETATYNQSTSETVELQPGLNATLDSTDTTGATDNATYTINASGDTSTVTVDNSTNTTVTVDGVDVTIEPQDIRSGSADTQYEYPATYGWGNGATSLWNILPVIIVLAGFLFLVGMAVKQF